MKFAAIAVSVAVLCQPVIITPLFAHGGRTAADGCHNDRQNGGRHCHGGSSEGSSPKKPGGPYANCTAAREAGAAPVRRGEPGYGPRLDRDGDGIGCE